MPNSLLIKKKIREFDKIISISGDKSISIRWVLLASLASGVSKAQNLLISKDVQAAIRAVRKLGIKVINLVLSAVFLNCPSLYESSNSIICS